MFTTSITVNDVIDALAVFLTPFVDNAEIVRAQVNRVAMPANPCVILTELLQVDLMMPYMGYNPNETANISGSKRIDVQIDFYGVNAGDYCTTVELAFRSQYGFTSFPSNIKPLYLSDGIQSPLITGEEQYESRWTLTASLQYNPTVVVPQQSAIELIVDVLPPADLEN